MSEWIRDEELHRVEGLVKRGVEHIAVNYSQVSKPRYALEIDFLLSISGYIRPYQSLVGTVTYYKFSQERKSQWKK